MQPSRVTIADNKHHSGYKNIYISVNGKGKSIASHRMAWNLLLMREHA